MSISADIQFASTSQDTPSDSDIDDWICQTLHYAGQDNAEITVRIVDEAEIASLNNTYRNQNSVTDVLAFPYNLPAAVDLNLLGDVIVCANVVNQQAVELNASVRAHWARIIAHGVLHLCGFDHEQPDEAREMEGAERVILQKLGFEHPDLTKLQS